MLCLSGLQSLPNRSKYGLNTRIICFRVAIGGARLKKAVRPRFLRNDEIRFRLHGLKNKSECFGPPMQIIDYPLAVACLVERRAGIDVLHSVTHSIIEQDCDLARRSRYRLGLADARREPPVECAQRGVGPSNSYG